MAATLADPASACAAALIQALSPLGRVLADALMSGLPGDRLSIAQYRTLSYLAERDRLSSEIARCLGVTPSSITTTVDVLVGRGLVGRHASPTDRRCVHLRITAEGSACLARARGRMLAAANEIVRELSEEECQGLTRGLEALRDALEARAPSLAGASRRGG